MALCFFEHVTYASDKDGIRRVDGGGGTVMLFCEIVFALLFEHSGEAIPRIIMPTFGTNGCSVG